VHQQGLGGRPSRQQEDFSSPREKEGDTLGKKAVMVDFSSTSPPKNREEGEEETDTIIKVLEEKPMVLFYLFFSFAVNFLIYS
jgi:hypothetical protein